MTPVPRPGAPEPTPDHVGTDTAGGSAPRQVVRTPKKAAIAAWVGSALEYYDFVIYGTAASLIFPKIFFPEGNPAAATVASLATFGVGYVARPVGSFVLGHVGDKLGRKKVLIFTLLLMGVSTFLVGCLPTYQSIGILAPVLLVVLRLLQGLSAAGEQAGANSMSFEHAPDHRRGFFTSWTLSGTQGGQVLAPGDLPAARGPAVRGPAALVGLAHPVLPQRRGRRRRVRHPPDPRRDPGLRVRDGGEHRPADAPLPAASGPLARRAARDVRGLRRHGQHALHGLRPRLRDEGELRRRLQLDVHALGRDHLQPRGHRRDPLLGQRLRPGRPQAGLPRRSRRLRGPRRRLRRRHRERQPGA